ncbi:MAG: sulfite exporter TauE/SafE family protein [SAR324 cluster bacterium]|nr:sulfite exporter TauE/SafE family protein [SAR324 cluster bacterium]
MITDPIFYICAIPAILVNGLSKGGFGGVGILSVPLIAIAIGPIQAAAILLPILVVMDGVALWSFRKRWSMENLKIILPGAILGIVIGTFSFRYLSEDAIRVLIGTIAVVFCLNYLSKRSVVEKTSPNKIKGIFWGTIAGFTSFGIHSGGPPIRIYLLPQRLEKTMLAGTMAIFFAVVNFIKLLPYAWLGQLDQINMMTALVLMPLAPIGVRLGVFLLNRTNEKLVYRLYYLFLFAVGIKLSFDGSMGLIRSLT